MTFSARAFLAIVLLAVMFWPSDAMAKRMALVIGIDDYKALPKLEKAVGDARAMSGTLETLGFEVTQVINATRRELNVEIAKFASKLTKDDLAFVHFSGHGVEIDGENFLLAADVPKPANGQKDAVKYEGIGLRRLIGQITSTGVKTRVFVLDACRDNPFEQVGSRSIGSSRGLARTEAPVGTFIMYSAGTRQVALDKLNDEDGASTSVFTRVLLKNLPAREKSISQIARDVREQVQDLAKSAGHTQRPAYYDELSAQLYLNAANQQVASANSSQTQQPKLRSVEHQMAVELTYWNSVKSEPTVDALQSYLEVYPTGRFAPLARIRIKELKKKAAPAEEPLQQTASIASQPADETRAIAPVAETFSTRELTLRIQKQLSRVGCSPGRPDGVWGRKGRRALRAFVRHSKVQLASLDPSQDVLSALTGHDGRVCPLACGRRQVVKGNRCVLKTCSRSQVLNRAGRCVAKAKPKPKSKKTGKKTRRKPTKVARTPKRQCGVCKSWAVGDYFPVCGSYYLRLRRKSWCRR